MCVTHVINTELLHEGSTGGFPKWKQLAFNGPEALAKSHIEMSSSRWPLGEMPGRGVLLAPLKNRQMMSVSLLYASTNSQHFVPLRCTQLGSGVSLSF